MDLYDMSEEEQFAVAMEFKVAAMGYQMEVDDLMWKIDNDINYAIY